MQPLSPLNGHPNRNKVAGVEANTGPLGHGLPIAVGTALAAKMDESAWRTFVLTGDGELQEGSNWEAAMSAAHFELDNLTLIVDRTSFNKEMRLSDRGPEPLRDRWQSFGWSVPEVNGHDVVELRDVLTHLPLVAGHRHASLPTRTRAEASASWKTGSSGIIACRRMPSSRPPS